MTFSTTQTICSKSCGFSAFMLGLCDKLNKEGNRPPTEREATEIAEQERALADLIRAGIAEPAVTDFSVPQL